MAKDRALYIGPRLRRLRLDLGLTQAAMAADLEISPSYIALLERNQRPLTADLLLRLANTYQIDLVGSVLRDFNTGFEAVLCAHTSYRFCADAVPCAVVALDERADFCDVAFI